MTFMKVTMGFLVGVACAAGVFYYTLGGFNSIEVSKTTFPSTEIFFTTHRGSYEKISESWEQFTEQIAQLGVKDCDAIGIYLDAPNVAPEKLRSVIGCKTEGLSDEVKANVTSNFSVFTVPEAESYSSPFPYVNVLSFWLAPMKIYPEMKNLIATNIIRPSVAIETYGFEAGRSQINIFMPAARTLEDYQTLVQAFDGSSSNQGVNPPPVMDETENTEH